MPAERGEQGVPQLDDDPVCGRSGSTAVRSGRVLLVGLGLILALGGATCRRLPDEDGARGQAVERALDDTYVNSLECRKGDCADWHRVRIRERGTLSLDCRAVRGDEPNPLFTVQLEDGFGDAIDAMENVGDSSQRLMRVLDPGVYLVGIEAPEKTRSIVYELTVGFEPAPRRVSTPARVDPGPRVPTYRRVDAEVLEVEGSMAEPSGVLLDLGGNRGVYEGLRGELVEGDSLVGDIRVVNVYEEGSRASVALPLRRPITPAVRAVLLFPSKDKSTTEPAAGEESGASPDAWDTESDAFQPYVD